MPDTAQAALRANAYRIAGCVFLPRDGLIRTAHETIRLEPRLSRLLNLFVENPGIELGRGEILDRVWPDNGSDEALTQAVSRLRQYLGRDVIRTLPRIGYVFVASAEPATGEEIQATPTHPVIPTPVSRSVRWRTGGAFIAGLASGLALAVLLAPVLMTRQIEIEETVNGPADETRLVRTSAECSLLDRDCVPPARDRETDTAD
jgi:DNA-binding winged helix-turn-helix (wHTH) protein